MAAQTGFDGAWAAGPEHHQIQNFLESSFHDVEHQFESGTRVPTIAFTDISTAKIEGIKVWKHYLQSATGLKLQLTINAVENTVSIAPVDPIMATANLELAAESNSSTSPFTVPNIGIASNGDGRQQASSKYKVPRPPNAFIIYRREKHASVVRQHPTFHNNDISVIIGRMWRSESDSVKASYKRKADDAKHQHAIDHPGYQYQPRKPSEKKKRMTKTKLAKLKAQTGNPLGLDPSGAFRDELNTVLDTHSALMTQAYPTYEQHDFSDSQLCHAVQDHSALDFSIDDELYSQDEINLMVTHGPTPVHLPGPRAPPVVPQVDAAYPSDDVWPSTEYDVVYPHQVYTEPTFEVSQDAVDAALAEIQRQQLDQAMMEDFMIFDPETHN